MTNKTKWKYYKMAVLPDNAPHEIIDTKCIKSREIWTGEGKRTIFARWTSDFDCGHMTDWWYVIKTEPFDITEINSKKRYKINRGMKYFDIKKISPSSYKEQIYQVQLKAYSDYPEKYRPTVNKDQVFYVVDHEWNKSNIVVIGAFQKDTEILEGYIQLEIKNNCIISVAQKANPEWERFQINYALLAGVLNEFSEMLATGYYINVGERNVQHETAFQDFVIDIFKFRKAYCKLNVEYNPKIKWVVKLLYIVRKPLEKLDNIKLIHKINGVLKMEEIVRRQEKRSNS